MRETEKISTSEMGSNVRPPQHMGVQIAQPEKHIPDSQAKRSMRDFGKSAAERARCQASEAHGSRGSAWTVSMGRERRPRLDVQVVVGGGPVWRGRRHGRCGIRFFTTNRRGFHRLSLLFDPVFNKYSEFDSRSFEIVVSLIENYSFLMTFSARI